MTIIIRSHKFKHKDMEVSKMANFYRGICESCKILIDSTYCEKVTDGYKCVNCGELHSVNHGQVFFVHMSHIDGKQRDTGGRITLKNGIVPFIRLAGSHGWHVEYTPITIHGHEPVIKMNMGMQKLSTR